MSEDTIKDIVDDARSLALDVTDVAMLRYGIERIAERLEAIHTPPPLCGTSPGSGEGVSPDPILQSPNHNPQPSTDAERDRKAIGNMVGNEKIVSYAIDKTVCVTVAARRIGEQLWTFDGIKDGLKTISGYVKGGKWMAAQYCKFIRNGIISRARRLQRHHGTCRLADGAPDGAGKAVAE